MPNCAGPILNAYQLVVPVSACTIGSADFKNSSTSRLLPGFDSSNANIASLSTFL